MRAGSLGPNGRLVFVNPGASAVSVDARIHAEAVTRHSTPRGVSLASRGIRMIVASDAFPRKTADGEPSDWNCLRYADLAAS